MRMHRVLRGSSLLFAMAVGLAFVAPLLTPTPIEAKTPGKTYCFRGYCHRVLTLSEIQSRVGTQSIQSTSNYDDCKRDRFNPCGLTSSGAVFGAHKADNAASPIYPDGNIVLVRHPKTQKSAVLRINNAGPYHGKRLLDVSRATAEVLGFKRQGVANLEVRILKAPTKAEASYRRNRVYDPVPGYLGEYASIQLAAIVYSGTGGSGTQVAAIYPQSREGDGRTKPIPLGNSLEKTWLAKGVTFKPNKQEAKEAKLTSSRMAKLDLATGKR